MAEAVLTLRGDATSLLRTLGQVRNVARQAASAFGTDFQRGAQVAETAVRNANQHIAQSYAELARARQASARASQTIEQRASEIEVAGANYRTNARRRETDDAVRSAEQVARARELAERRATQASQREANRRAAIDRQRAREQREFSQAAGGMVRGAGASAMAFGSAFHGEFQGARARRAASSDQLNQALYQAGAGTGDAASLRARVYAFARANGIDSADLATGINAAQTEFSVLGNSRSSQADRSAALEQQLQNALFARNTGQSTGEVMRVAGLLQNAGITGDAQHAALLGLTGMAQRGAIELGAVTRTAMAPMQARMAQAAANLRRSNPNATADQVSAVQRQAAMQTFAEMEVGRSLGMTPRAMGNITAQLGSSLQSDRVQQAMLTNLQHAHATGAISTLFESNGRGGQRLRSQFTSALGLAGGLQTAFGGDVVAMQNTFAGGGHGNAQSLQANWRRTLGALMGGGEDVQRMIRGAGTDFTEADVQRGAGLFGTSEKANLTRNTEAHDSELTQNTGALGTLSNTITQAVANNPLIALLAGSAGPGLAGVANMVKGAGGLTLGGTTAAAGGGVMGAVRAAGTWGIAGAAALLAGAAVGTGITRGVQAIDERTTGRTLQQTGGQRDSVFNSQTWMQFGRDLRAGFGLDPVRVAVDPATAAHLAAASRSAPSGETRETHR
jgi:hypothetical protein